MGQAARVSPDGISGVSSSQEKKKASPFKTFFKISVYFQFVSSDLFEIVFRCGMVLCF